MNRLRRLFLVTVALLATCLILFQYRVYYDRTRVKNILYWTPMFQQLDFNLGLGSKIFENCTYKNCYATFNKNYLAINEFDAILFHGIEYTKRIYGQPQHRDPNQIYIFSNQESPMYTPHFIQDYNNFYNWTMTYRLDSDVMRPYGFFERRNSEYQLPTAEEIEQRPKKIAWLVSNCGTASDRELLVKKLQKFIPVDIYGNCGNLTCAKNASEMCYRMLENNYKFYLSFENSICEDYVTEKLYNALKYNIVPIVYGGADYEKIAPPRSVINVMNFKTIKKLVQHIEYLDNHPLVYLKYLEWKRNFVVSTSNKLTLCTLCKKLNQPVIPKFYSDIFNWWRGQNLDKCPNGFIKKFL